MTVLCKEPSRSWCCIFCRTKRRTLVLTSPTSVNYCHTWRRDMTPLSPKVSLLHKHKHKRSRLIKIFQTTIRSRRHRTTARTSLTNPPTLLCSALSGLGHHCAGAVRTVGGLGVSGAAGTGRIPSGEVRSLFWGGARGEGQGMLEWHLSPVWFLETHDQERMNLFRVYHCWSVWCR